MSIRAISEDGTFYSSVLDSLPMQVAVLDRRGALKVTNHAWRHHQGGLLVPEAERLMADGRYLDALDLVLDRGIHLNAASLDRMRAYVNGVRAVIAGTVAEYALEYEIPGQNRWFRAIASPARSGDGDVLIQRQDVTAEVHATQANEDTQRFLQSLIDLLPTRIAWKDVNGRYLGCNRAFLDDAGGSAVLGRTDLELPWGATEGERIMAADRRVMEDGVPDFNQTHAQKRPDGSTWWLRVDRMPLLSPDGSTYGILVAYADITAMKRVEAALANQAAEMKRLALVAERTNNAVAILDPELRMLWVNEGFVRTTGYSREEALGKHPRDVQESPLADPATIAAFAAAVKAGHGYRSELLNRTRDGRDYWVDVDFQPLRERERITGWVEVSRDIDDEVNLRRKLVESEERLRMTVEGAELGLYDANLTTGSIALGAGWYRLVGLPAADQDSTVDFYLSRVHPDDLATMRESTMAQAMRVDTPSFHVEYRLRHEDGRWIWVHDTARVVLRAEDGRPARVIGVLTDISVRKAVEQAVQSSADRLALAASAAGVAVWDTDVVTGATFWDARMLQIHGLPPDFDARRIDHGTMARLAHPDDLVRLRAELRAALESGPSFESEFRIVRPDGEVRTVDVRAIIHRLPSGAPARAVGIAMDVTERRAMQSQHQQAQRLEAIGQLAAGIAHEINTPTQYIGDNIRFLKESFDDLLRLLKDCADEPALRSPRMQQLFTAADYDYLRAEVPRAIEQSLEGISRVAGIVRAMKDFSHPASERSLHDLNRAIESTITVATNEWKYLADLDADLDPALPMAEVMPGEFKQVILNMIVNAAHAIASAPGQQSGRKGRIRICTRRDGDHAVISISDTGCGMPAAVQERIFEPFFTTKPLGQGTGQGLAIAHGFIARHGGTIRVESAPGEGACFTMRLPLRATEAGAAQPGRAA